MTSKQNETKRIVSVADKEKQNKKADIEGSKNASTNTAQNQKTVPSTEENPLPDKENPNKKVNNEESENTSTNTVLNQETTETKQPAQTKENNSQTVPNIIQAIIALATLASAILGFLTLLEMQNERDNTYSPVIVITPNTFEGGLVKDFEEGVDKDYIYMDYNAVEPNRCFANHPLSNDNSWMYLETPYLTLRNIGQGVAKDVRLTFSVDWMENAVNTLNKDEFESSYHFDITQKKVTDTYTYDISYSNKDNANKDNNKSLIYIRDDMTIKNITNISPGDDSVKVLLPECWIEMFAIICNQSFRTFAQNPSNEMVDQLVTRIPDIVISVQYYDIQGKPREQKLSVPWTMNYKFQRLPAELGGGMYSFYIKTGFYEDYVG